MSVHDTIRDLVTRHKIVVYMKGTPTFPQCGFSAQTVAELQKLGVPFHTVNVLSDPTIREGIKTYSQWPTIPQVFINGQFVGGCDIVKELSASGELRRMVDAALGVSSGG
jgi:monothiol glutaredoxin